MKLYKANSFEIEVGDFDLVITDPPYLHNKSHRRKDNKDLHISSKSKFANSALYRDGGELMEKLSDFDEEKITEFVKGIHKRMKKTHAFIFCNETQLNYYINVAHELKLKTNILVWEKPLSVINKNRFSLNVEFIIRIYTKGCTLNKTDKNELYNRVQKCNPVRGKGKVHTTQKPVSLIERILEVATLENQIVFDPFMGSGTTGVACENLNRKFIGVEMNETHFNIAEERILKATGRDVID